MINVRYDIAVCCKHCEEEGLGVCPNEIWIVDERCFDEFIERQKKLYVKTGNGSIIEDIKLANEQKQAMLELQNSPYIDDVLNGWQKQDEELVAMPNMPLC